MRSFDPLGPLGPQLPHPECGSRNSRDNSLILVITGVEAGERPPSPRSGSEWPCWPAVGGRRPPVVDTWTNRPLCTEVIVSPPCVPAVSLRCPQAMPTWRSGHGMVAAGEEDGTSAGGAPIAHNPWSAGCGGGSGAAVGRAAAAPGAVVDHRTSPGTYEISPTCAHSWGQLLDESMVVTARSPTVTALVQGSSRVDSSTRLWTMTLSSSGRHRGHVPSRPALSPRHSSLLGGASGPPLPRTTPRPGAVPTGVEPGQSTARVLHAEGAAAERRHVRESRPTARYSRLRGGSRRARRRLSCGPEDRNVTASRGS